MVPSLYLQGQWGERIPKWGLTNIEVWVINSLVKRAKEGHDFTCDLLILDEIHRYTAETFSQVFECVTYRHVLGLTATVEPTDDKYQIINDECPVIAQVSLAECLRNGWVSPFTVYNYGIILSPEERERYREINQSFHKWFAVFEHDFQLAMACLGNEGARTRYGKQINWNPNELRVHAINWNRAMQDRKTFLYDLPSKLELATEILTHERFKDKKAITFAQTTEAADTLAAMVGSEAEPYHSAVEGRRIHGQYYGKDKYLDLVIRRFKEGILRVLSTAKALDEGADIPDVDLLVVLSGTSTGRQGLQRYGRGIRYVEGKHTIIIELYAIDTQDERWLRGRQKKVPQNAIKWVRDLDEIG